MNLDNTLVFMIILLASFWPCQVNFDKSIFKCRCFILNRSLTLLISNLTEDRPPLSSVVDVSCLSLLCRSLAEWRIVTHYVSLSPAWLAMSAFRRPGAGLFAHFHTVSHPSKRRNIAHGNTGESIHLSEKQCLILLGAPARSIPTTMYASKFIFLPSSYA